MALALVEVGPIEAEEAVEEMNGAVVPQEAICLAGEVTHLLEVADLINILRQATILDQSTTQVIFVHSYCFTLGTILHRCNTCKLCNKYKREISEQNFNFIYLSY